jgi:hypothetical protein
MMDAFREVRRPSDGKLLFRFDPSRDLIEVVDRRVATLVDLTELRREVDETLDRQDDGVVISSC